MRGGVGLGEIVDADDIGPQANTSEEQSVHRKRLIYIHSNMEILC